MVKLKARTKRQKEYFEKYLIWDFFDFSCDGYFLDVGAFHSRESSQTWLLEKGGWKGIVIEPQPENAEELRRNRPFSKVYQTAISRPGNEDESTFFVNSVFSTLLPYTRSTTKKHYDQITVPVTTLDKILEKEGAPQIDFLKIDVEGTELDCLKGFDIEKYRPKLIFVEDIFLNLDLHKYLSSKGYRLFRRTRYNNWYVPNDDERYPSLFEKIKLFRKMVLGTPIRAWKFKRKKARLEKKNPSVRSQ
jgi:FkbM family methyltransferase